MFKSHVTMSGVPVPSTLEDAMKQALISVVQVWLDRLQQQAVVATFFVSIDSLLFTLTSSTRPSNPGDWSKRDQVINASLGGAIIFHVFGSIVAYVASFVLIRYRLNNAVKSEEDVFRSSTSRHAITSTHNRASQKRRAHSSHAQRPSASSTLAPSPVDSKVEFTSELFTDLRGLVSVYRTHPLQWLLGCGICQEKRKGREVTRDPEASSSRDDAVAALQCIVGVLSRAHTVCAGMTSLGFVLALLGILTYSWTAVPAALGISASVCMGACAIAATIALW